MPPTSSWYTPQDPVSESLNYLATGSLIGLGAAASLFPQQTINIIRAAEAYSPGGVLKTFGLGSALSFLDKQAQGANIFFSAQTLSEMSRTSGGRIWLKQLSSLAGQDILSSKAMREGLRFEKGRLLFGKTSQDVFLKHATLSSSLPGAHARFQEAYTRSLLGGPVNFSGAFTTPIRAQVGDTAINRAFFFSGGQTKGQAIKRGLYGYGTSLVERLNQLARAPAELPGVSYVYNRLPIIKDLSLGVKPSTGLKTLGKLVGKLGIAAPALYMAYQQLDWTAKQSELLDETVFAEGITAGIATLGTRAWKGISTIAEYTGLHSFREAQEEMAPGSTSLGALMAFPMVGAMYGLTAGYTRRVIKQRSLASKLGLSSAKSNAAWQVKEAVIKSKLYDETIEKSMTSWLSPKQLSFIDDVAEKELGGVLGRATKAIVRTQQGGGLLGKAARLFGKVTPGRAMWMLPALAGAAMVAPFLPGALVPDQRPEELERLYSGKQDVEVRRGAGWEFGRSAWEGGRISRFKKHWYAEMLAGGREKALYGEDSPMERWYKKNLTYEYEQQFYKERPYPISAPAFADTPLIGPLLSATVGNIIKPQVLMHEEEWKGAKWAWEQGGSRNAGPDDNIIVQNTYAEMPKRFGYTPVSEAVGGELAPGAPINPYGLKGTIGEQMYRFTEMVGLPGFMFSSIKEAVTGKESFFENEMQLQSAQEMLGAERAYWDKEIGGAYGLSELFRRLYPHKRRQIEQYNPIANAFADVWWLPGEGEKSPNFKVGDPYAAVKSGETRLPGAGYAALYPELEGIDPSDYPLIHRLKILGDVAPYTDKFKKHLGMASAAAKAGQFDEQEMAMYQEIKRQVNEKKVNKVFSDYKYREKPMTEVQRLLMAEKNREIAGQENKSIFSSIFGKYWETIAHGAETPIEYLTPASPAMKLIHQRTAIEDYERTQVWGTESAFWNKPIENFIKPFFSSIAHSLGWEGIPEKVQEKRDIESYFDTLKYVKYTALKRQAEERGDQRRVKEYEKERRQTLLGVNPYTYNHGQIYRSLPRRERDYFKDFVSAGGEDREKILGMIPENQRRLMSARWQMEDVKNYKEALKKGLLNEEQAAKAEQHISDTYRLAETEGLPKDKELWAEYLKTRLEGESYPDWYRRVKIIEQSGMPMPGPDWVGFNPTVNLDDIKLKVVQDLGKSMYDFDLWRDRERRVARRPAVHEAAAEIMSNVGEQPDPEDLRDRLNVIMKNKNIGTRIVSVPTLGQTEIQVSLNDDKRDEARNIIRRGELN